MHEGTHVDEADVQLLAVPACGAVHEGTHVDEARVDEADVQLLAVPACGAVHEGTHVDEADVQLLAVPACGAVHEGTHVDEADVQLLAVPACGAAHEGTRVDEADVQLLAVPACGAAREGTHVDEADVQLFGGVAPLQVTSHVQVVIADDARDDVRGGNALRPLGGGEHAWEGWENTGHMKQFPADQKPSLSIFSQSEPPPPTQPTTPHSPVTTTPTRLLDVLVNVVTPRRGVWDIVVGDKVDLRVREDTGRYLPEQRGGGAEPHCEQRPSPRSSSARQDTLGLP